VDQPRVPLPDLRNRCRYSPSDPARFFRPQVRFEIFGNAPACRGKCRFDRGLLLCDTRVVLAPFEDIAGGNLRNR
ncbi:MAG: hypothetical protein WCO94_15065, partial [Verrucomicrobiota bacterium]